MLIAWLPHHLKRARILIADTGQLSSAVQTKPGSRHRASPYQTFTIQQSVEVALIGARPWGNSPKKTHHEYRVFKLKVLHCMTDSDVHDFREIHLDQKWPARRTWLLRRGRRRSKRSFPLGRSGSSQTRSRTTPRFWSTAGEDQILFINRLPGQTLSQFHHGCFTFYPFQEQQEASGKGEGFW